MIKIASLMFAAAALTATTSHAFPDTSGIPSTQQPHSDAETAAIIASYVGIYHGYDLDNKALCTITVSQPDTGHLVFGNQENGASITFDVVTSGLLQALKYEDGPELNAEGGTVDFYGLKLATVKLFVKVGNSFVSNCERLTKG